MFTDLAKTKFSNQDLADLRLAKSKLENPNLAARVADLIGRPIEAGFKLLPHNWNQKIREITQAALLKGLELAMHTLGESESGKKESHEWLHKVLVTASGVAGGAAGLASLAIELPISTAIILRSIAEIARSEGHQLNSLEVKLSCLEVFALGGTSQKYSASESGYWAVRGVLAKTFSEAATYIAERGFAEKTAPPLVRFIAAIASRFSAVVTEEIAAKAIPVVGAVAGGTINLLFMDHFQEMARGHFIIKRLEKKYGAKFVEQNYNELRS
jgi:hypothetical protein